MNRKSCLFQEEDTSLIQQIFAEKLHKDLSCPAQLMSGGLFNTIYKVQCADQIYVIRFGPVNRHLLMGFEEHLMEAEYYVYSLCKEREITCPDVLVCDTSRSLVNRDYMIMKYISGSVMLDAGLLNGQKGELFEQIGAYAANLHTLTDNRFGFVSRILTERHTYSWAECLIREAEEITDALVRGQHMSRQEAGGILHAFLDHETLLNEIRIAHLLHTDLWEGNVMTACRDGRPYLKTVIDADRAVFGDEDFEWAAPWMNIPAVLQGAGICEEDFYRPERKMRRQIYRIFYALMNCYAGIFEYHDIDMFWGGKEEAARTAEAVCRGWQADV